MLKHAANLWGDVLEDTAEVLHSLAGTSFWVRGHFPLIFIEEKFFEKVKEHFGVILRILLFKSKHLRPPLRRQKMSIAAIEKRRFYILRVLKDCVKKGENFKIMWSWTYRPGGPGADISPKSSLSIYPRTIF